MLLRYGGGERASCLRGRDACMPNSSWQWSSKLEYGGTAMEKKKQPLFKHLLIYSRSITAA